MESESIRVALVHSFYATDSPSGENHAVLAQAEALERAGHQVEVFGASTDEQREQPLYRLRSALRVATGKGKNPLQDIRRFGPDITHVHNLFPNIADAWLSKLDSPYVVTLRNYRPICANGFLLRQGKHCSLCVHDNRWSGVRYRCYRNSSVATLPISIANRQGMAKSTFRNAAILIALSRLERDIYIKAGVPPGDITVIPNLLPTNLDPGRAAALTGGRAGWLFVGRLSREKGVLELLDTWPSSQGQLTVVGDGPLRETVQEEASRRGVRFLGACPRSEVIALMLRSHGLVFSSLWPEVFGNVYIEALAAGLPVLAIGQHAVAEMVEESGTGWNISTFDELSNFLSDAHATALLRQTCRETFETLYASENVVRRLVSAYDRVLAESSALG